MKYGLRKDDKIFKEPKKKWRKAMEDVIKYLEFEVKLLKGQLQEATDKIKRLEPKQQKINIFLTEEREIQHSNTRSVRYQQTLQWENNSPGQMICITAMPEYQNQSLEELRVADYSIAGQQQHRQFIDFGLNNSVVVFTGTEHKKYQGQWDVDPLTWIPFRYNAITVLPEYGNKSFEELRLEDYILKSIFSNKTRFDGIRSTTADSFSVKQRKQLRNAGLCNKNSRTSHRMTSQQGDSWSSFEDYESTFNISDRNEHVRDVTRSSKPEELFNQMLLSLNKMETHLSDVNFRLSSVDSRLFDLKSQVSVMDSRLSAVDMFVAVERVNKKWQGLEPQLANLETPTKNIIESPNTSTDSQVKSNSTLVTPYSTVHETKSFCEAESSNIIKSSNLEKNNLNLKDISLTLSTPNDSLYKIDIKSVISLTETSEGFSNSETNVEKAFSKETKVENDHSKDNNLESSKITDLIVHSLTKMVSVEENDSINLGKKTSFNNKEDHNLQLVLESKDSVTSPNKINSLNSFNSTDSLQNSFASELGKETSNSSLNAKERNIKTNLNDQETCVANEAQSLNDEGDTSDSTDNDYVIIEKKDLDDVSEKEQCSFGSAASKYIEGKDYKVCSNITEYLEENLGKKKDVVYEFGFEVKPDFSGTDSLLETSTRENDVNKDSSKTNASLNATKVDSFSTFLTQLTENHHERSNQSSPVVQKVIQHYKKKHLKQ